MAALTIQRVFIPQQAIEKVLKAFLAFNGKDIPKTHDLDELQRLCLEITDIPPLAELDFAETTGYAVELRYDLEFWPEQEIAEDTLPLVAKFLFGNACVSEALLR